MSDAHVEEVQRVDQIGVILMHVHSHLEEADEIISKVRSVNERDRLTQEFEAVIEFVEECALRLSAYKSGLVFNSPLEEKESSHGVEFTNLEDAPPEVIELLKEHLDKLSQQDDTDQDEQ